MKRWLVALLLVVTAQGSSVEKEPWLGNWLEFEGALFQSHTQSRFKHKFLHAERTRASIEFMPLADLSAAFELDLVDTQSKDYGFEAIKAACRYKLLNDLTGDPVSLTCGLKAALSTPSRVKDLSSIQHGVFETEAFLVMGREFAYHDKSYYKAWGLIKSGLASSGSPWLGLEAHFTRVFKNRHYIDLFFRAEKGLSSRKLHHAHDFHSWSRIGYTYEDIGLTYRLKEIALGSLYLEATTRLHARYYPKHAWSLQLGFVIPFSPW